MIDDGVGRKFDCIIVASMYYCGPGFPAARQSIKETLYETGVDLIVLEEGLDTRTASRKEVEDYFEEKRDARRNHVCMEEEAGRRIPADQFRSVWLYPQEW